MDAKAGQQPSAEQRADDADRRIDNQAKARSAHDPPGEIADGDADKQNNREPVTFLHHSCGTARGSSVCEAIKLKQAR
jgi:hypothetical protein